VATKTVTTQSFALSVEKNLKRYVLHAPKSYHYQPNSVMNVAIDFNLM